MSQPQHLRQLTPEPPTPASGPPDDVALQRILGKLDGLIQRMDGLLKDDDVKRQTSTSPSKKINNNVAASSSSAGVSDLVNNANGGANALVSTLTDKMVQLDGMVNQMVTVKEKKSKESGSDEKPKTVTAAPVGRIQQHNREHAIAANPAFNQANPYKHANAVPQISAMRNNMLPRPQIASGAVFVTPRNDGKPVVGRLGGYNAAARQQNVVNSGRGAPPPQATGDNWTTVPKGRGSIPRHLAEQIPDPCGRPNQVGSGRGIGSGRGKQQQVQKVTSNGTSAVSRTLPASRLSPRDRGQSDEFKPANRSAGSSSNEIFTVPLRKSETGEPILSSPENAATNGKNEADDSARGGSDVITLDLESKNSVVSGGSHHPVKRFSEQHGQEVNVYYRIDDKHISPQDSGNLDGAEKKVSISASILKRDREESPEDKRVSRFFSEKLSGRSRGSRASDEGVTSSRVLEDEDDLSSRFEQQKKKKSPNKQRPGTLPQNAPKKAQSRSSSMGLDRPSLTVPQVQPVTLPGPSGGSYFPRTSASRGSSPSTNVLYKQVPPPTNNTGAAAAPYNLLTSPPPVSPPPRGRVWFHAALSLCPMCGVLKNCYITKLDDRQNCFPWFYTRSKS